MAPLGQSAIEMSIAAVNEHVLPGDMRGLRRNEKQHHGGDFVWLSHALAQRYLRNDVRQLLLRIRKCADPLLVERRNHFGGNQGIHANSAGKELRGPISR